MAVKVWLTLAGKALILSALLFGAAGTIRWPAGWAYVMRIRVQIFALSRARRTVRACI
jgi:hypothetical protein